MILKDFLSNFDWTHGNAELFHWGFIVYPDCEQDFRALIALIGADKISSTTTRGREIRHRFDKLIDNEFDLVLCYEYVEGE